MFSMERGSDSLDGADWNRGVNPQDLHCNTSYESQTTHALSHDESGELSQHFPEFEDNGNSGYGLSRVVEDTSTIDIDDFLNSEIYQAPFDDSLPGGSDGLDPKYQTDPPGALPPDVGGEVYAYDNGDATSESDILMSTRVPLPAERLRVVSTKFALAEQGDFDFDSECDPPSNSPTSRHAPLRLNDTATKVLLNNFKDDMIRQRLIIYIVKSKWFRTPGMQERLEGDILTQLIQAKLVRREDGPFRPFLEKGVKHRCLICPVEKRNDRRSLQRALGHVRKHFGYTIDGTFTNTNTKRDQELRKQVGKHYCHDCQRYITIQNKMRHEETKKHKNARNAPKRSAMSRNGQPALTIPNLGV